uniref:Uncharacterized protein n=2 Tax=Cyprinus carpio TaxID=7962 RepID=A0A9R1SHN5_CYPCA
MGNCQMQDLIMMFLQSLNLHTGNAVIQPLELPFSSSFNTRVARHRAWDAVVVVEELLPEKLIPRHSKPLTTGEPSAQHSLMREMQEDFQHQAVRQARATCHPDILKKHNINDFLPITTVNLICSLLLVLIFFFKIWVC